MDTLPDTFDASAVDLSPHPSVPSAEWRRFTGAFPTITPAMPLEEKQRWAAWVVAKLNEAIPQTPSHERSGLYALRRKWVIRAQGGDARYNARGTTPGPMPKMTTKETPDAAI